MHIVYVSQYFPPEMGAPAARVHELSREWVRLGHRVTVVTGFAHHPTGVKAARDRGVLTRREVVDGIDVIRTYVYATANQGIVKRMLSYASFCLSASTIGRVQVRRPDVVIGTSPQLLCAVAAYILARTTGAPFVFEVRDLWPESILAVEALRENLVIRGLKAIARFLYRHSEQIVTVGEGYARGIHQRYGIPLERMAIVRNGIDTALFVPLPRDNEVRRAYGWGDRFVVMYVGTHGMAHGLGQVLEAARLLREERDFIFVFVGEGAEKARLKQRAVDWQLSNVQFIDQQPKSRIPLFYAACDVGVVCLRDTPLFQEVLPSKMFEYLGMERPILINVGGEARQVVEASGGGLYFPPGDAVALAVLLNQLSSLPQQLHNMGQAGRSYVLSRFDRREQAALYLRILSTLTGRSGEAGASGGLGG
jgi:colanic acid biosynthesis glycosyl transferase WcaI